MKTIPISSINVAPVRYAPNPYLGHAETEIIVALIKSVSPETVIEIGTSYGLTARCILWHTPSIQRYVAIDVPPDCNPTLPDQKSEVPAEAGRVALSDPRFYTVIRLHGSLDLTAIDLEPCDAVFIDGDHSAPAVRHDSLLARELIRPGGIIVWHDYGNRATEVKEALDRLCDDGWEITLVAGTWTAFWRNP